MQQLLANDELFMVRPKEYQPTPLQNHERGHIWSLDQPIDSAFKSASSSCRMLNQTKSKSNGVKHFKLIVEKTVEVVADFLWPTGALDTRPLICKATIARSVFAGVSSIGLVVPELEFKSKALKAKLSDKLNGFVCLDTQIACWLDDAKSTTSKFEGVVAYEGVSRYEFTNEIDQDRSIVVRVPRKQGEGYVVNLNGGEMPELFRVAQTKVLCCSDQFRTRCLQHKLSNIDFIELGVFV